MAYFPDLTFYEYFSDDQSGALNVGWLERGHAFETAEPSEETLDLLWAFVSNPVMLARGFHFCDLCTPPAGITAKRLGTERRLGNGEIRVFSRQSTVTEVTNKLSNIESALLLIQNSRLPVAVFAAPTLIYHYIEVHYYKPPNRFLNALREGPHPTSKKYSEHLASLAVTSHAGQIRG